MVEDIAQGPSYPGRDVGAERLAADLAGKPAALHELANLLAKSDPFVALPSLLAEEPSEVLFLGLGSARYASGAVASRLRHAGIGARAEYSSAARPGAAGPETLIVAVAVGALQRELLAALDHYADSSPVVALTNNPDSPVASYADIVVPLLAGDEDPQLAVRGYQHALALLLSLAARLGAPPVGASADVSVLLRRVANATADLLERAPEWVPRVAGALTGVGGVHLLAPMERLASARQGMLIIRKGPVRVAHASETAEWSHTDRYLAAVMDYRALLFAGSRFDERAAEQILQLRGAFVTVGGELDGQAMSVRFPGDGDEDVRLLTESLVAELLAAHWWAARGKA